MIVNTPKNTYYILSVVDNSEDKLVVKGFKNINDLNSITIRKITIKKENITRIIYLDKETLFLINRDTNDFRRFTSIKELIALNKEKIVYVPAVFKEVVYIYNKATNKFPILK